MDRQEKIDQYLRGKMSPGETAAFENEVAADPALAQELELQRLEQELLLQLDAEALRAKVRELRANETAQPEPVVRHLHDRPALGWRWKAAAAAAVVVLLAAVWFWTTTYSPAELVAEGYRLAPPDYSTAKRSSGALSEFDPNVLEILVNGDKRQAGTAVQYFRGFRTADPELEKRVQLNLAHALILAGDFREAAAQLAALERSASDDKNTREKAQYFRALALLGEKDLAGARQMLDTIAAQPAHDYRSPAETLLQKIKNLR